MKPATLNELKREIKEIPQQKLLDTVIRLIKYKKENKELLTYLLFEADDEGAYIKGIKDEIDTQYKEMNKNHIQYVKKACGKY